MLNSSDLEDQEKGISSKNNDDSVLDKSGLSKSEDNHGYWSPVSGNSGKKISFFNRRKKPLLIGGGLTGILLGGGFFTFTLLSGPFQFIHIGQLLDRFHFAEQKLVQDERFARDLRYFRSGEPERTRMGKLGNLIADKFESKLNDSGFKSAYSDKFGLFDGYVIDRTNPKFKNMTDSEIKDYVKTKYGVDLKYGSEIKGSSVAIRDDLVIDGRSLGAFKSLSLTHTLLGDADLSNLSAVIGSRFMGTRMGVNFDPLTKLKTNTKSAIEQWFQRDRSDLSSSESSVSATDNGKNPSNDNNNNVDKNSSTNKNLADGVFSDVTSTSSASKTGAAFESFKASVSAKMFGGTAAAIGILCIIKGINDNYDILKYTQVILPLIKLAMHTMAVGSQIQSGNNVNLSELSVLSNQLNGVDAAGNKTSWYQSKSIQANLGNNNTGVKPSSTLTSIGAGHSLFSFLDDIPGLSTLCGTIAQTAIMIFSFATDFTPIGLVTNVLTGVALSQGAKLVIDTVAHWMVGSAVDVNAVGADFGNEIDYGATLAANQQSVMAGGTALSSAQVAQNNLISNSISQEEFSNKPIFAKLFDLTDYRSLASRLADNLSTSTSVNILNTFSYILNSGKNAISGIGKMFTLNTLAATSTPYDYGFPIYGFSQQDLSNPAVANPYDNANYVANLFDNNSNLVDKAKTCFGVDITKSADGTWDVLSDSSSSNLNIYSKTYNNSNCDVSAPKDCTNNNSDECNWLRIRFFIIDTETSNSMGCYAGDNQACSDIGF